MQQLKSNKKNEFTNNLNSKWMKEKKKDFGTDPFPKQKHQNVESKSSFIKLQPSIEMKQEEQVQ